ERPRPLQPLQSLLGGGRAQTTRDGCDDSFGPTPKLQITARRCRLAQGVEGRLANRVQFLARRLTLLELRRAELTDEAGYTVGHGLLFWLAVQKTRPHKQDQCDHDLRTHGALLESAVGFDTHYFGSRVSVAMYRPSPGLVEKWSGRLV